MIEVPHYKIEKELGTGGMSTVYLATHEILDRQVALKIMSPSLLSDGTFKECFINEGRIISKLNNPHVIHIYDIGISNDACYMAIELLEGDTLRQKIDSNLLSNKDKQKIVIQISSALNAAHSQNFIHRDIKPGNILFRKNGDAVLTDFGISKIQDTEGELTTLGFVAGTPSYMPPEFSMGEELDHRADIYSLGVVFYEMLTGEKPYKAKTAAAISFKHVNSEIPKLEPSLAHYQNTIDKALAKKPEDRFDTVMDFAKAIEMSDISMAPTLIAKREDLFKETKNDSLALHPSTNNANTEGTEKGADKGTEKKKKGLPRLAIGGVIVALLAVVSAIAYIVLSPDESAVSIKNVVDPSEAKHIIPSPNIILNTPDKSAKPIEEIIDQSEIKQGVTEIPVEPSVKPVTIAIIDPAPITPKQQDNVLTDEQAIIVSSLLDNCLIRASVVIKEKIRISKNESIIKDIKNLEMNSGRTKFITDTRRQISSSIQRIKTNTATYYKNVKKLNTYKTTLVLERLNNRENDVKQGIIDILVKHLDSSAKNSLTLEESNKDFSQYAKIILSTF